jgi:hypothetical protein
MAQGASGMLSIEGHPSGAIYVDHGQIVFAQSSSTPDLSVRLHGTLRPSFGLRELLAAADRPDRDIGTILVQQAYLTRDELQAILRSVVVDALIALTAPADEDAFVSRIGFASSVTHWASAFLTLDASSLQTVAGPCTPCSPQTEVGPCTPCSPQALAPLPRRTHEAQIAPPVAPAVAPASTDVLRRVLDGLRRNA